MMKTLNKGFSLLEIMLALAITALATGYGISTYVETQLEEQAKYAGELVAQYNSAVAARLADINEAGTWGSTTDPAPGVDWLKSATDCGGTATGTKNYLPCNFPSQLPFGLTFTTVKGTGPNPNFVTTLGRVLVNGDVKIGLAKIIRNTAIEKGTVGPAAAAVNKTYDIDFTIGATEGNMTATAEVAPGTGSMWVRTDGTSTMTGSLKGNGTLTLSNNATDSSNITVTAPDAIGAVVTVNDNTSPSGLGSIKAQDIWIDAIGDWASNISGGGGSGDTVQGAFYQPTTGTKWNGSAQTSGWINCGTGSQPGEQIKISTRVSGTALQTRIEANYSPITWTPNWVWEWVEQPSLRACSQGYDSMEFKPYFLFDGDTSYTNDGEGWLPIDGGPYTKDGNQGTGMPYGDPAVADPAWGDCLVYFKEMQVNHPIPSYGPITYYDSGWINGLASVEPNAGYPITFDTATSASGTLSSGVCSATITTIKGQ